MKTPESKQLPGQYRCFFELLLSCFFWDISPSQASRLAQIRNTHRLFLGFPQSFSPWDHISISPPHPQKLPRKKNGLEQGLPMEITQQLLEHSTKGYSSDTPRLCWALSPLASRSGNKEFQRLTPRSDRGHGVALESWKHVYSC